MHCAPILITTLCRYQHFVRLIESLRRNEWAEYTEVYIGLDFPAQTKHVDGYNKINEYLNGNFNEFKAFHVIRRKENYGSARNIKDLRQMVLSTNDCYIRADDDAEFSPNFIKYMNICLRKYRDDKTVFAVAGYSYPLQWKVSDGATILFQNFICPVWGIGYWKDKFNEMYDYIATRKSLRNNANDIILSGAYDRLMNTSKSEFVDLCLSPDFNSTLASFASDIAMNMYVAINNKYVVTPVLSKVRNWGFDGSGEYCADYKARKGGINAYNYPYHTQVIDDADDFILVEDVFLANNENRAIFNKFDVLPFKVRAISKCKLCLYRLLGERYYFKTILWIRKIKSFIL